MLLKPLSPFIRIVGLALSIICLISLVRIGAYWMNPIGLPHSSFSTVGLFIGCTISLVIDALLFLAGVKLILKRNGKALDEYAPLQAFLTARLVYLALNPFSVLAASIAGILTYWGLMYYLYFFLRQIFIQQLFPQAKVKWTKPDRST